MLEIFQQVSSGFISSWSSSILGVWRGRPTTQNVWHWSFIVCGIMLDILQQVISVYLTSWSSSILGVQLNTPTTTTTSCDTADHQFLVQDTRWCDTSHTRWCDTSRTWLPFQLTYTLWAPSLVILHTCGGEVTYIWIQIKSHDKFRSKPYRKTRGIVCIMVGLFLIDLDPALLTMPKIPLGIDSQR